MESVNSGAVPVHPFGLDAVPADDCAALELKALRAEGRIPLEDVPEKVLFTGTLGARAACPQQFKVEVGLDTVGPSQSKFATNYCHVFEADLHWTYTNKGSSRKQAGIRAPRLPVD